ncbi:metal-sensing transcriptional repressor [Silvimonas sp.]|uniref:metal-sensing transcriptional repressor n=1 Tax=Silvimonas sp. TaxID=2650811 RepID=UPI00283C60D4|nr:metal-sensing transcriptional repressor [Silvimonas sp.]MDR3426202.1 metal-sensing transcriptional repressor [Silvimonas sp.]
MRRMEHTDHPEIINRLRRAEGHLKTIMRMLEEQRACLDIAQQLQAVEKAIASAKRQLVQDHIDHCLENAVQTGEGGQRQALDEFKQIVRYL